MVLDFKAIATFPKKKVTINPLLRNSFQLLWEISLLHLPYYRPINCSRNLLKPLIPLTKDFGYIAPIITIKNL